MGAARVMTAAASCPAVSQLTAPAPPPALPPLAAAAAAPLPVPAVLFIASRHSSIKIFCIKDKSIVVNDQMWQRCNITPHLHRTQYRATRRRTDSTAGPPPAPPPAGGVAGQGGRSPPAACLALSPPLLSTVFTFINTGNQKHQVYCTRCHGVTEALTQVISVAPQPLQTDAYCRSCACTRKTVYPTNSARRLC